MKQIDRKTHRITEDNHYKTKQPKTQIIIGSSLRKNDYHITRLKHKNRGKNKRWNCYTVKRTGKVFEHYNPEYYTDFLKIKKADKQSISIVLEKMGGLIKVGEDQYVNWLNELNTSKNIGKKKWMGSNYWEKYSIKQLNNTALLCKYLCEKFDIPLKCIEFHHYHDQAVDFNGIIFRSNYFENSNDMNPFLNIEEFNKLLQE